MAFGKLLAAVLMAAGVCACSAPGTRFVEASRPANEVFLTLRDAAPPFVSGMKTIDTRNPNHKGTLIPDQREDIWAKVRRLNEAFVAGYRDDWPQAVRQAGLAVSPRRAGADELRITVLSRQMDCNAWTCAIFYEVKTELLGPGGASVWHAVTRYGQGDHDTPIDARLFEAFAQEVTGFMRQSRLVAAPPAR